MKRIDSLPCFYYIIASLKDADEKQQASFALSYIHYLQKEGTSLPKEIEQSLSKLPLLAQFSNAGRKTPLDFLTVSGNTYHLADETAMSSYTDALYKACGRPLSFRELFTKINKNQSICHLCPYAQEYSNKEQEEEESFAKTLLEKDDFFLSLKSDDIPKIFQSYYELSNLIPNIRKPIAFPALECLITAVQIHAADYFGGFFSKDYTIIADSFRKQLNRYGIKKSTCSNLDAYDSIIYDSLINLLAKAKLCEAPETLYQTLLSPRDYSPAFLADSVPDIPKTGSSVPVKKERKKKTNKQKEAVYQSYAGTILDSVVNAPEIPLIGSSDISFDSAISESKLHSNLDSKPHSNLDSKMHSNLDSNLDSVIAAGEVTSTDVSQIDVLNSSGEIIHAGERQGLPYYDYDADMGSLYEADEWDEDWEDLSEEKYETIQDEESLENASIKAPANTSCQNDADADITPLPKKRFKNGLSSLPENMPFFTEKQISDNIYRVPDVPSSDRMTSLIKSAGYCIIEPVLLNKQCHLCILHDKDVYMAPFANKELIQPLLKDKKIVKATLFPFALYGTCQQFSVLLKNIYPLAELALRSGIYGESFPKDITEQLIYAKNIYNLCKKSESAAALLPKITLLSEALGYSFYRNRFLHVTGNYYLVTYSEDGISCTQYHYRNEKGTLNGSIYTYSFLKRYRKEQYQELIEKLIVFMTDRGLFRRLNVAVLSMSHDSVSFFMDTLCQEYLTTVISSTIFTNAYEMGLKNIDFEVTTSSVTTD